MKYKVRYNDQTKQNAYMNACDCLFYGYGKSYWNDCGCNDREEIWLQAKRDMSHQ